MEANTNTTSGSASSSSMVERIAQEASHWTSVDLLVGDTGFEAFAVRGMLEEYGIRVNLFPIGLAQHVINVLSGLECTSPYVIWSCHGEDGTVLLPPLAPEVATTQRFNGRLTADDLATFVDLPGRIVISMGCETGTEALARSFLDHGCEAYIAPEGSPRGHAATFFVVFLFYELTQRHSFAMAMERIRSHDEEVGRFRLFR